MLLCRKIDHVILKRHLEALWAQTTRLDLIDINNNYFIIRFYTCADYEFTITYGPWLVFDHYLVMCKWQLDIDPFNAPINHTIA